MKALVAGWFSFIDGHATAGDLLNRDVVCHCLDRVGCAYEVALAAPFSGGVDWRRVDPGDYSHVLFVCGPFQPSAHELEFVARFTRCRLVGLNLSMREPTSAWNPFDLLLERDSSDRVRADLAFLSPPADVPVIGLCLVEPYAGALVNDVNAALNRLIESAEMAIVRIDTRLDVGSNNPLRTPREVAALIGRVDVLLTTRLHGLVLALKTGVPTIAIDPEPGGAKIRRQAGLLGWPVSFVVDAIDDRALAEALQYCLSEEARALATRCGQRARDFAQETFEAFEDEMEGGGSMEVRYRARMIAAGKPRTPGEAASAAWPSFGEGLRSCWIRVCERLNISRR